jgi:hypothetical protein
MEGMASLEGFIGLVVEFCLNLLMCEGKVYLKISAEVLIQFLSPALSLFSRKKLVVVFIDYLSE